MDSQEQYLRFPLIRRIEHWVVTASFFLLALTGIPQRYFNAKVSDFILRLMGGIEIARIIHRFAAGILLLAIIFHVGLFLYNWYVMGEKLNMLPTLRDLRNAWQAVLVNLGVRETYPEQGFYTFEEKIEYWALVWGIVIMAGTGFFLWNPIAASRLLPGEYIPAAKAAHGGEAVLAVLAIIVWHLYHVVVRHFNRSMFTGYMSREEMERDHPLALDEPPAPGVEPALFQTRRKRFWIVYGTITLVWLAGIVWFVAGENTASATYNPAKQIQVYTPLTATPAPTAVPVPEAAIKLGDSWENGIGDIFESRCGDCHNPRNQEAHLDLTSYSGALQGGDSGPAVVPNAPGISLVLIWPNLNDHPGKLSPLEKAAIQNWISQGANP